MINFFRIPVRWVLAIAVTSLLPLATAQTVTYSTAGVYTNVAPAGVNKVTFKLWGAGGGSGGPSFLQLVTGGGGAFSSVTLDAMRNLAIRLSSSSDKAVRSAALPPGVQAAATLRAARRDFSTTLSPIVGKGARRRQYFSSPTIFS